MGCHRSYIVITLAGALCWVGVGCLGTDDERALGASAELTEGSEGMGEGIDVDDGLDCVGKGPVDDVDVRFRCTKVDVEACKELSNVVLELENGELQKFDELSGQSGTFAGTGSNSGQVIVTVWVKAGNNKSGDGPGYGERFDGPGGCAGGWLVYPSERSGQREIWATRTDGSRSVQLTDGILAITGRQAVANPRVSWDYQTIAFGVKQNNNSSGVIWAMNPDGSGLHEVVSVGGYSSFGWEPDSRHVIYTRNDICHDPLLRIDALTPGAPTMVWSQETPALWPMPNPVSPTVLYSYRPCGGSSRLRLLDLTTNTRATFPDLSYNANSAYTAWSRDGSGFSFTTVADGYHSVRIREIPGTTTVVANDPNGTWSDRAFDEDGTLYIEHYSAGQSDISAIDVASGTTWVIVPDRITTYPHVGLGFGYFPEIDNDGDGLANGIDPTP